MNSTINYAVLFGGTESDPPSLLGTYYGIAGAGGQVGADPIAALRLAQKNQTRDVARTAKTAEVLRDVRAFTTALGKARTTADALSHPAILKVLLTANGLADQLAYGALATKVLLSDPADKKSLVNRLGDTRWKAVAQTFQFASKGLAVLRTASVQSTLANGYAEVAWRRALEKTTPGLSNALDFSRRAGTVTSVDQILGDGVLRNVVTTAYGIPQEIAFQPLPAQERAIATRLDIARLRDPHFVDALTQRFLLAKQQSRAAPAAPDLGALAIQARGLVV